METNTDHFNAHQQRQHAFPPIADRRARALVLGSMPGQTSLAASQYYAHPRNAFWPIMAAICGFPPELGYRERCDALRAHGIALWDVLKSCVRPGSLDSNIDRQSAEVNDFGALFNDLPCLELIAFNGATAEQLFRRHVLPNFEQHLSGVTLQRLPSTSPAMATLTLQQKRELWSATLAATLPPSRQGHDKKKGPP